MVTIDEKLCTKCNLCVRVCPAQVITPGPVVTGRHCIECGQCYAVCPSAAVTVVDFSAEEVTPGGEPVSSAALLGLLAQRRSNRAYQPEPVAAEHLEGLLRAAALAPSAHNGRPLRAYIYTNPVLLARIRTKALAYYRKYAQVLRTPGLSLVGCTMGYTPRELKAVGSALAELADITATEDRLFYDAPVVLAIGARRSNPMTVADGWMAMTNAMLYAETVPLAACINGYLSIAANGSRAVRAAMELPRKEHIIAAMTLGYPARKYQRPAPRKDLPVTWK
ncbi:MAG TPA: nitroreductase family protein [Armatimonadota bacterium]|jgi:nitroreductase/NAD-dependent dihydropyrimidine dehydrogenase PreA subunit